MGIRFFYIIFLFFAIMPSLSFSEELPSMEKAAEIATDILYIEVVDFYGTVYIEADIKSIFKGSYNNKVWIDRTIEEGDKYPFTVGEKYVLFLRETIGDTFKFIGLDVDWAIHKVDASNSVDFTSFSDIKGFLTLDETANIINSYIDPFYNEDKE